MTTDRKERSSLQRIDDNDLRFKIANARRLIYDEGYTVDSTRLDGMLKARSLVPTHVRHLLCSAYYISNYIQNAFSNRLRLLGFNYFDMLVIDLMHEVELGVWKNLFVHLLRIIASVNPNLLHEVDRRYIPIYHCMTIY